MREHVEGLDEKIELNRKTQLIEVFPKSIVNKVNSPDIPFSYSINPYQGCEHGCTYCYARNSHMYWGYEPALDFESKLLFKREAPSLLREFFNKKRWKPENIVLSGNTDCYQPIEKELQITRSLLEVFLEFKNPLGIVTKNNLIRRDIDLLADLAKDDLVHVFISLTTLNEELRQKMEPRTASSRMRLNGSIATIFVYWLEKYFPDRAKKVIHQIEDLHGGKLNDSSFGRRMKGNGSIAQMIRQMIKQSEKNTFLRRICQSTINHCLQGVEAIISWCYFNFI